MTTSERWGGFDEKPEVRDLEGVPLPPCLIVALVLLALILTATVLR